MWKSNNTELRSVLQSELRSAYSQLQLEHCEIIQGKFQNYQKKITQSSNNNNNVVVEPSKDGLEFMFPLLTGEELKAFDSSVFE